MLKEILKDYGLSDKEAKLYLASLSDGEATAQDIAKKSSINRATVYVVVDSLIEKGLIFTTVKGKKKYFSASPPNKIIALLEAQKKNVDSKIESLKNILPELESIYNYSPTKPRVRYFDGLGGLKEIYENTLEVGETIYAFTPIHRKISKSLLSWLRDDYVKRRVSKNIKAKVISPRYIEDLSDKFFESSSGLMREIRGVPADQFPFTIEIQIYGPKIAIVSYTVNEMFGVVIESEDASKTWRSIFDLAWQGAAQYK